MGLSNDYNKSPYFDDYDTDKGFHRVLFKPGLAVQTRELNQLQSILQNQIERFGDNILMEGTIVSGCNFTEIRGLGYVKIRDLQGNGAPVSMTTYRNGIATGKTTGLKAVVTEVMDGFESQAPDLNTIFVTYLNTGPNGDKVFSETETIEIRDPDTDEVIADVIAAGAVESASVGRSYAVRVSDGWIYQKGFFIHVENQLSIVTKYTGEPDGIVVGFETGETIVTANADTSLLDNANGFPNANAPGADRLHLSPTLVAKTLEEARADEDFFTIQEYAEGRVVRRNTTTQYGPIFDEIRKRTHEESGNYTVQDFRVSVSANTANTDYVDVSVGSGLAYVEGRRVELVNTIKRPVSKSTEYNTEEQQNIVANYGQYIIADELIGSFNIDGADSVTLHDTSLGRNTSGSVGTYPSGSKIGSARVRAFAHDTGVVGDSDTTYRIYLYDIRMDSGRSFSEVRSIFDDGSTKAAADIPTARLYETTFKQAIYPIGRSGIRSVVPSETDYVFRANNETLTVDSSTGDLTINLSGNNEWPYGVGQLNNTQKRDIFLVAKETQAPYSIGKAIDLSGATVTVNSSQSLTISLGTNPAADMDVSAQYSVKKTAAAPTGKDLKTVYVKIDTTTHPNGANGPFNLGMPDVISVENAWVGSEYSQTNTDKKNSFRLSENQSDTHYGLSFVSPKRGADINGKILLKVKVFKRNISGSFGTGYFSVNSYPVDDANPEAEDSITTQEIPIYVSEGGSEYNLRNCIDFRPYAAATSAYAESAASATENPSDVMTFGTNTDGFPAPNSVFEADYEYYLGRADMVMIDSKGNFVVIEGDPAENPAPPSEPQSGLVLATLNVPPYPSLPKPVADRIGKPEYAITMRPRDNRRFTMRDIGGMQKRIENIEYYTSLNALEQDAVNMLITDENGVSRFKNGIFVDNFKNLMIADIKSDEFSAGIDPSLSEITPKFVNHNLDLKEHNTSGWSKTEHKNGAAFLTSASTHALIDQPYATKTRNCVTDFYSYNGNMRMLPADDSGYDTTRAPDVSMDITDMFAEYTDALSEIVPMSSVERDVAVNSTRETRGRTTTTTTRRTTTTTTTTQDIEAESGSREKVGDFVTDVRFNPFLRSRWVRVKVTGLRPNTRHYFFFDGEDVNDSVAKGQYIDGENGIEDIRRASSTGSAISSNGNGELLAVFFIPAGRFYVGDRKLEIFDVDDYTNSDQATSRAAFTYHGFNFSVEKAGLYTSVPQFSATEDVQVETNTTVDVNVTRRQRDTGGRRDPPTGGDPISQTFSVEEGFTNDNALFVDSMKVFFKSKSNDVGVTLQIRETQNGYPSKVVVPGTSVHLSSDDVNVSDDSTVATQFQFENPVPLKTGREYAVVVIPDGNSPDYLIYVAQTGQTDLSTGASITHDAGKGTLFTSTNNSAWTAYQDENMKFQLVSNEYDTGTGHILLTNKDNEFLNVENINNEFKEGEQVFVVNDALTGTVSVTAGNRNVSGSGTNFENLEVGDPIVVKHSTDSYEILKVATISSSTSMQVETPPIQSGSGRDYFKSVTGRILSMRTDNPALMVLEDSSAKTGNVFAAGGTVRGEDSGATAEISEVKNQNVSYLQPSIRRTNTTNTRTSLRGQVITFNNGATASGTDIAFNSNKYLNNRQAIIKSRSNEISDGTGKSFVLRVNMENLDNSTPVVKFDSSSVGVYEYLINNDTTDEETPDGAAETKYVSKTVELADGLDADDIKVFLTAYRPVSSDVEVYIRFQNVSDPRKFEEIEWTKLEKKSETNSYSSNANRFDFKEFEFSVPSKTSFANGGGAGIDSSDDVIRYKDENGTLYERYKYYAIKIVMVSETYNRVPRLADVRAIALS